MAHQIEDGRESSQVAIHGQRDNDSRGNGRGLSTTVYISAKHLQGPEM
jgi:hypothetical protein